MRGSPYFLHTSTASLLFTSSAQADEAIEGMQAICAHDVLIIYTDTCHFHLSLSYIWRNAKWSTCIVDRDYACGLSSSFA